MTQKGEPVLTAPQGDSQWGTQTLGLLRCPPAVGAPTRATWMGT